MPPNPALKKGRRYLVGYVGVMGKQEGIDLLLQAVQLIVLHLERTDIHFGLVGGGTELPAMQQLAKDLGIADYVTFTGRVPDAELLEMLNTADICVNPDRANEMNDRSTMNKIMEYMALGKPVVQFDLTEGRVSAGDASWYARPNDVADLAQKMVSLLGDELQRRRMGAIGRDRIEHVLSWQHEAPRLLGAYEEIFAICRRRRTPYGLSAQSTEVAEGWLAKGCTWIPYQNDAAMVLNAARAAVPKLMAACGRTA